MIRSLRSRHRRTFVLLAVVLPIGLAMAFSSRVSVPASPSVPQADRLVARPIDAPVRDAVVTSARAQLRLRIWSPGTDGTRVLELTPRRDLELPDVLVYWSATDSNEGLPAKSLLLGSLAGTEARLFSLPKEARGGRLFLYSLAHQELVASLELEP
ncbi:MAG TPA: hypothetical protein VK843_08525 [Planctomycetota bacterium]|nr:hypothetical protein [Planctomycetota bacterium]